LEEITWNLSETETVNMKEGNKIIALFFGTID
jgi:hypothetical protein